MFPDFYKPTFSVYFKIPTIHQDSISGPSFPGRVSEAEDAFLTSCGTRCFPALNSLVLASGLSSRSMPLAQ